jgi:multiple sugar transport system ATP-binding protein
MAEVEFEGVSKVFPDGTVAVNTLDLLVPDGEFMILVGPSGSGKSTALRMLAGLEEASGGRIRIGDRTVNDIAPKDRDIAMVFQSYALYPHMSVADNMGFALKIKGYDKPSIGERVERVAQRLGIKELLARRPRQLSGGQRQRVALGRAIVRAPQAFLMDEPLSNLDAKLRVEMRAYIARLHHELGATMLYVTHDQVEAMTMGDRVAVMRDGHLEQCDTPQNVYDAPANLFVAAFIGSPAMNLLRGRLERAGDHVEVVIGSQRLRVPEAVLARRPKLAAAVGGEVVIGIRPESLDNSLNGSGAGRALDLPVLITEALGSDMLVHLELDAGGVMVKELMDSEQSTFTARLSPHTLAVPGQRLRLLVDMERAHFFDPETEEALI